MHKIIAEQNNNKQKNHKLGHKQCSSAGRFLFTYSVGAVTLLIFSKLIYYRQRILFGTASYIVKQIAFFSSRVRSAHRHGRPALILALPGSELLSKKAYLLSAIVTKLRNVPSSILLFVITILTIISAGVLGNIFNNNSIAYAADSISLNISTSTIALDLFSYDTTGTFAESPAATITASTTSSSGYTLSIASSSGSTDLINGTDHTSKITSISSNLTAADFSNAANTQYNNKWGYKPSQWVTVNGDTHTTTTNTGSNAVFKPLPNASGEILAITESANPAGASDSYTMSIGSRVNSDTPLGDYSSETFIITAVTNTSVVECDDTKLCVQFDGNGLTFPATEAQSERVVNNVNYDSVTEPETVTRILHSDNVGDDGVATGNSKTNTDQTKETTIDGASNLNVSLYYDTEGASYDWVTLYAGADSVPSSANDGTIGSNGNLTGKLGGNKSGYTTSYTTWNLWNNNGNAINSDTIKIHFKTDNYGGSYISYGYYAIITGTGMVWERTLTSGEYTIPTGTGVVFHGWSSTAVAPGAGLPGSVEYADEAAVKAKMPGDNGETKTLYAVWQQPYSITFTKDSNVASIAVVDDTGATVATITSSGQSVNLVGGNTYTIKPTYNTGYTTNTITKTAGAGTLTPKGFDAEFTVGAGSATINVTSRQMFPIQNYNCANLVNIGDTDMVYDARDNTQYMIGKLADGKCWMLDNLALDLYNTNVLNSLSSANTNIDPNNESAILTSLKSGNRSAGDQYATAGLTAWGNDKSYSVPMANLTNKEIPASYSTSEDPMKDTVMANNWKMGGYYNYCAASAGSYCFGSDTTGGTPSGDATSSICPKGWRMPTGNISGEFATLYNAYSSASPSQYTAFRTAFRLPLSGFFFSGSDLTQGVRGYWWSGTRYNATNMYYLYANTTGINPSDYANRNYGFSLRCVLGS